MRLMNDASKQPRFTLYPHGALTKQRRRPARPTEEELRERAELRAEMEAAAAGRLDELATVVVVGTRGRKDRYVEMDLTKLDTYDDRDLNADNLDGSEGLSPIELGDYITSVSIGSSIEPPYGSLAVSLSLTASEAHTFLGGVGNREIKTPKVRDLYDFRNLCTGAWVVLRDEGHDGYHLPNQGLSFFGKVSSATVTRVASEGIPIFIISLTCSSFFEPLMRNEIKQTLRRDKSIEGVHTSAIFATSDYTSGFLKALIDDFGLEAETRPASFLKKVIDTLVTIDLPASLTFDINHPRTWYTLGDIIQVVDGSKAEMGKYGLRGADADVIKGKILNSYQGQSVNNMTHGSVINQLFLPNPELMEMIALTISLEDRDLKTLKTTLGLPDPLFNVYKEIRCIPVIVYRYRPVYPYAPPTAQGNERRRGVLNTRAKLSKTTTFAEDFFGSMPIAAFPANEVASDNDTQVHVVAPYHAEITNMQYTVNEGDRINYVFVEQAWTNGQAQNQNLARNNAKPTLNVKDINRHGLRSFSTHTPFISRSSDKDERKTFNLEAANALAERIYHNIGMGHQFLSGMITLSIPYGQPIRQIHVGTWVTFMNIDDEVFTCYVVGTNIISTGGEVPAVIMTLNYERGHFGLLAPAYDDNTVALEYDINHQLLEQLSADRRLT